MYADFTDYQGTYCGTLITTQGQWMPAVREACAYLDSITFGRLKCGAPVDDAVKLAACALRMLPPATRPPRPMSAAAPAWQPLTQTATAKR